MSEPKRRWVGTGMGAKYDAEVKPLHDIRDLLLVIAQALTSFDQAGASDAQRALHLLVNRRREDVPEAS